MPITITLQRTGGDCAEAWLANQLLATFAPAARRIDQPLRAAQPTLADLVTYGQRLLAALGNAALQAARAPLPRAPQPASSRMAGLPRSFIATPRPVVPNRSSWPAVLGPN